MSKDWLATFSGGRWYPLEPARSVFTIEDVALGLAHECRYGGQTKALYSVAEHSWHVSMISEARARAKKLPSATVLNIARWGLLHDASEGMGLKDMPRPVKHQPELASYRRIEQAVMADVAVRYGLTGSQPQIVSEVDTEILGTEIRQLNPNTDLAAWSEASPGGKLADPIPGLTIRCLSSKQAYRMFLMRFKALWMWP